MKEFSVKKLVLSCIVIFTAIIAIAGHLYMRLKYTQWNVVAIISYLQVGFAAVFTVLNIVSLFIFTRKTSKKLGIATLSVTVVLTLICLLLYMFLNDYKTSELIGWTVIFISIGISSIAYLVCYGCISEQQLDIQDDHTDVDLVEEVIAVTSSQAVIEEVIAMPESVAELTVNIEDKVTDDNTKTPLTDIHIDACCELFRHNIPYNKRLLLRDALSHADESKYASICAAPTKDPTAVLLYSIFLGGIGVDRFYLGDKGLGVAKIFVNMFTMGIWWILDIYFCHKKVKENNLVEILKIVNS